MRRLWCMFAVLALCFRDCPYIKFDSEVSDLSLENLASTGANYVAIIVTQFQENINTTEIFTTHVTATDAELKHVIEKAHSLQLNVMLKPHIDLTDDPAHWRGDIGKHFTEEDWEEWFQSYSKFLLHYAELAEQLKVEQFSLGCELIATSPRDREWREVASQVRKVFSGSITYSANWGGEETNKTWWDVVDMIGVDAYYPLAPDIKNATVNQLIDFWHIVIEKGVHNGVNGGYMTMGLRNLTEIWKKDMIFTEVGYCSGNCTKGPEVDLWDQEKHFAALFGAFREIDFLKGVFWWNWDSDAAFGGPYNFCMTPQFKPTEDLLRAEYGGTHPSVKPSYPAICPCIL